MVHREGHEGGLGARLVVGLGRRAVDVEPVGEEIHLVREDRRPVRAWEEEEDAEEEEEEE